MPFLKSLVRQVVQRAAQDPRVRDTAKKMYEEEFKPRAKTAWEKAKPEIEAAWEKAKPEVKAAKERAMQGASNLADRVRAEIKDADVSKPEHPTEKPEQEKSS